MVFDIGPLEFIALAVIALLVAGPEKLPRYAADAARMLRQLRRMANDARAEVSRELGPEFNDINLADLNPRTLVRKHLIEPLDLDDLNGHRSDRVDRPAQQAGRERRGHAPAVRRGRDLAGQRPRGSAAWPA